jgi:hypothetical protein
MFLYDPIAEQRSTMIITEPRWKSLIVETTSPLFTPEQCQLIINAGRAEPVENGQVGGGAKGGTVDTKG